MKMKKIVSAIAALSLVAALAVGGTLAYLQNVTAPVVNTFVIGDGVALTLSEESGELKDGKREHTLVPGTNVTKNPKVQVTLADGGSFYVFVKIEEGADVGDYYTYSVDDAWAEVTGVDEKVYYRQVETADSAPVSVLAGDCITVLDSVESITEGDDLDLTFTAYAIQTQGFENVQAAWNEVKTASAA